LRESIELHLLFLDLVEEALDLRRQRIVDVHRVRGASIS
jgi:hypothetical protein